jgi:tetratricopeptide (TPR) repeat protein
LKSAIVTASLIGLCWARPALAEPPSSAEHAREAYAAGKARYESKDYVGALSAFEQSYALSQSTALLFDIAQAHRLAGRGHCAASRRYYRSYLELEPNAENSREVSERLTEIQSCADAEEQASAAAPASPPPSPPARPVAPVSAPGPASPAHSATHTAAMLTTGVGAALLLSGAVLYFRARQRFDEVKASCPCRAGSFSDWQNLSNLSYGLLAVGGAGVAVGGTYWAISVSRDNAHGSSALLAIEGRF